MNNHNKIAQLYILGLLLILTNANVWAAARAKPVVAIKTAKVGEGVSKYALKYLNLTTLLAEMEASVQKNRKFNLVSRKKDVLKDIRKEQEFAKSDLTLGNAAAEGEVKNANFLILPTVQDFKFYRTSKPVPNLDHKFTRVDSGMLEVNAQVIDTSTGEIKTTFYMKSSFATKKKVVNTDGGAPNSNNFTKMAKAISAEMTNQLVDAVFPMRVLNVQGQKVWINRGKDGDMAVGKVLKVFRPGIALIDPDTGENLGSAETQVGNIKITRINPKFSITEIIKGSEAIEKGDIVRE